MIVLTRRHRIVPPTLNGCGTDNPLICVCPEPRYGSRLDGCLTCGRPPFACCRRELDLPVPTEGPWAA